MENKKRKESLIVYYKANKITDKIYLGDEEGARDKKLLKGYGITHILICGSNLKRRFKDEYEYHKIEIDDSPDENILDYFKDAFEFIESGKTVYVHCIGGVNRSPTFVIGYLMWKNKLSFKEALEFVRNKRKVIDLNEDHINQLLKFESILRQNGYSFNLGML